MGFFTALYEHIDNLLGLDDEAAVSRADWGWHLSWSKCCQYIYKLYRLIYVYDKRMKHLTQANKHDRHLTQSSEAIDAQWQEMGMCIVGSKGK